MVDIVAGNPADYVVGSPSTGKGFNNDCRSSKELSHVTHAFRAVEILRSGALTGRLVYDASTLNASRIHVVWVSPNTWGNGYRYGNIAFSFDWASLTAGRHAYWIEVAKYNVHACRVLLTDQTHSGLKPYDPKVKGGPWWCDAAGVHHWNNNYCLEVMVEGDLSLSSVVHTHFVDHHQAWCSEHRNAPTSCPELGDGMWEGGARFVARVVGAGLDPRPLKLYSPHLEAAWREIERALVPRTPTGPLSLSASGASQIALSGLFMYGTKRDADAHAVLSLFASHADAREALRVAVETGFRVSQGTLK